MNKFCRLVKKRWNRTPIIVILIIIMGFTYSWIGFQNRVMRTNEMSSIFRSDLTSLKGEFMSSYVDLEINSSSDSTSRIANVMQQEITRSLGKGKIDLFSDKNEPIVKSIISATCLNLDKDSIYKKHLIAASRHDIITTYRMYDSSDRVLPKYTSVVKYVSANIEKISNSDIAPMVIDSRNSYKSFKIEEVLGNSELTQEDLKNYYILIPKRILPDADMFGVCDYGTDGRYQKNSKIILIDVLSIEDILTKYYDISSSIDEIDANTTNTLRIDQEMESFMFMLTSIILSIVFGVILFIDHTIKKCPHGRE